MVSLDDDDKLKPNYESKCDLYGLAMNYNDNDNHESKQKESLFAVSSIETKPSSNFLEIIKFKDKKIRIMGSIDLVFPATKLEWDPSSSNKIAVTSDLLRIYNYDDNDSSTNENSVKLTAVLKNKQLNSNAPLTSLNWNKENPSIIGVSSIDTTCSIWDVNKQEIKTHLIAHDSAVFDFAFGKGENTFLSSGADGSIRLFDLRNLDTCSILFETQDQTPITRIAWNYLNNNYIAAICLDGNYINVIDARVLNSPCAVFTMHGNVVNSIGWNPFDSSVLCSVGDDKHAYVWNLNMDKNEPFSVFSAEKEINNFSWSYKEKNSMAILLRNELRIVNIE